MIRGAIDFFSINGEAAVLSGWACHETDGTKFPVEAVIGEGILVTSLKFFHRNDFPGNNNFGFSFIISIDELFSLYFGTAKCFVVSKQTSQALAIWDRLHGKILASLVSVKLSKTDSASAIEVIGAALSTISKNRPPKISETAQHFLQVGMTSFDESVIVGKSGHLFLYGGSNRLSRQYDVAADASTVDAWARLLDIRFKLSHESKFKFIQLIIPEKQTVLPEYFPAPIKGSTDLLAKVNQRCSQQEFFFDATTTLRNCFALLGFEPYLRADSHLSYHGAKALTEELVKKITGREIDFGSPRLVSEVLAGDLGNKFGNGNIVENALNPMIEGWSFGAIEPQLIRAVDPASGHIGTIREWVNESPLVDSTVIIFGNSMFERGGGTRTLSWWMARVFRRTIFYWTPAVDPQVVVEQKPDIVIAQTVERFMSSVPSQ